jgi:hypothetical protein
MGNAEVSYGDINLRQLNDVEVKEQCQVKISNRFATLEN